jgi:hypothetical protein
LSRCRQCLTELGVDVHGAVGRPPTVVIVVIPRPHNRPAECSVDEPPSDDAIPKLVTNNVHEKLTRRNANAATIYQPGSVFDALRRLVDDEKEAVEAGSRSQQQATTAAAAAAAAASSQQPAVAAAAAGAAAAAAAAVREEQHRKGERDRPVSHPSVIQVSDTICVLACHVICCKKEQGGGGWKSKTDGRTKSEEGGTSKS